MDPNNSPRILLVDDDRMILDGLRRSLRRCLRGWHIQCAESGEQALEVLEAEPIDIIVTDMRMPGMNGAQLLAEVAQRHPDVVRFVLSGYADQDLILQCTGTAHQYLAKPCEPEVLQRALERAISLEARVRSARVQRFVAGLDYLPVVPAVYSQLIEAMRNPEVSVEEIGAIVSQDAGITANLLKLVNSAFFGLRRTVSDAAEAAAFLGVERIKHLVATLKVFEQFGDKELGVLDAEQVWSQSLRLAGAAKRIAELERAHDELLDQCFVSGILANVGSLVLAANLPAEYAEAVAKVRGEGCSLFEAEEAVFGMNHADVGGYLLGLWGLPDPVVEAITWLHDPLSVADLRFGPLAAVFAAQAILEEERMAWEASEPANPKLATLLERIEKTERLEEWRTEIIGCHEEVRTE